MDNVLYLGGLSILIRSRKNNTKCASFVWLRHSVSSINRRIQPEGVCEETAEDYEVAGQGSNNRMKETA
jgi:hypothetical protein